MYITYERDQWRIVDHIGALRRPNISPHEFPRSLVRSASPPQREDIEGPKDPSAFKPTWLIRTSDMKLVRGSEVRERYYTLSYSWNQSGDYVKNEHNDEYTRNDQGKHQIIFYRKRKAKKYPRGRTRTRVPVKPRFVKFERLIQQICKDFGVRYIWWDQYCIDQSNPEEKRREIMQMHSIYKNAYCALVLIPELDFTGHMIQTGEYIANTRSIMETEWVKRVWTLEEAFMSKRMLFVGRNVHMWSHTSDGTSMAARDGLYDSLISFLNAICTKSMKWNACIAMEHARKRTSTNAHDRYFALANMFPDKMADLDFSYDQPLLDLMLQFYERFTKNDPSILYFGAPVTPDPETEKTLSQLPEIDFIPSWTGIDGVHAQNLFKYGQHDVKDFGISPDDYSVSGPYMFLTCSCIPVSIEKGNNYGQDRKWSSALLGKYRLPVSASSQDGLTFMATTGNSFYDKFLVRRYGLKGTHFLPLALNEESGTLVNTLSSPNIYGGVMSLTEDCSHCVILSGLCYQNPLIRQFAISPVVTKEDDHYRAIGLCILPRPLKITNIDVETKHTFVIQ